MNANLKNFRLVVSGGGTGGHMFPIIALISELKSILTDTDIDIYFLGPNGFGVDALKHLGIKVIIIPAGKIPRYFTPKILWEMIKIPVSIVLAIWHMWKIMPDVVFSKGGFGGFSPVLAAWLFKIPILIHESDAVPGLANKISSHLASKIVLSFPSSKIFFPQSKTVLTGNPIRKEIVSEFSKFLDTSHDNSKIRKTLLVLGGSQGAQEINALIMETLTQLLGFADIIHQCGDKNFKDMSLESQTVLEKNPELAKFYNLRPFLSAEELVEAYKSSDVIISRAGAGSIFEIALAGKPSILIPLQGSAGDHQLKNAEIYTKIGASIMLLGDNATPHIFLEKTKELFANPLMLSQMAQAAKSFAKPEATTIIAKIIIDLSNQEENFYGNR